MLRCCVLALFLALSFVVRAQCWKLQDPAFPAETINDIHFNSPSNGFTAVNAGIIGRTTDGGNTWRPVETPTYENLTSVTTVSSLNAWAAGDHGTLLHSVDNGFTWLLVNLGDSTDISMIDFPSADTGFVVGDSSIYRTIDGGNTWWKQTFSGTSNTSAFFYVQFFGNDTGYACRWGTLYKTIDGGGSWTSISTPAFYMIQFADANTGYAIANVPGIDFCYKTTDGGTTWAQVCTVQTDMQERGDLFVLDTANVFILNNDMAIGNNARVHHTANGGQSWQTNTSSILQMGYGTAMYFTSATTGYVGELWGHCIKTYDRAQTFLDPPPGTSSTCRSIFFADSLHGWRGGGGILGRTTDGGATWTNYIANSYQAIDKVQFPSLAKGYMRTDYNSFCHSTDSGKTWSTGNVVGPVTDFFFISPTFGMTIYGSIVSRTYDGGQSWTTYNTNSPITLSRITAGDSLHWYATGSQNFSTLLYGSSNGGQTWALIDTLPGDADKVIATGSNTLFFSTAGSIYRSTDGGQSFQFWSIGYGKPLHDLSAIDSMHLFAIDNTGTVSMGHHRNYPRLYLSRDSPAVWQVSPIHSSFTYADIHFTDSSHGWLGTTFGSIYRYYPSGHCPPALSAPFLSVHQVKGCAGAIKPVLVSNYLAYNSPYDTVRARLLQGATVLWADTPSASGQLNVPIPAMAGSYTLQVTVSNPEAPAGLSTVIPVIPVINNPPDASIWVSDTSVCAGGDIIVGMFSGNLTSLGTGYTYELHRIAENGTDTVLALNPLTGILNNLSDTFSLYYKVNLGPDVCPDMPVLYTDTIKIFVAQPTPAIATLSTTAPNNTVCPGNELTIKVTAENAGISGRHYSFYEITAGGTQFVGSNTDSTWYLTFVNTPMTVFCRMFPGWGSGCHTGDTVTSDTLHIETVSQLDLLSSNYGTDSFCVGKPISLFVDTLVQQYADAWEIRRISGSTITVIGTPSALSAVDIPPGQGTGYYCYLYTNDSFCHLHLNSDTLWPNLIAPQKAVIQQLPDGSLQAQPPGAVNYDWFRDNVSYHSAADPLLSTPDPGSYVVYVTTTDSCIWLPSDSFIVAPSSVSMIPRAGGWSVFPNPGNGLFWIKGSLKGGSIQLETINGTTVYRRDGDNSNSRSIDVSFLPGGLYILYLRMENQEQRIKILIVK